MAHRYQGNTNVYWFIIKDTIKNTDEKPGEDGYRARSRRVLSTGASVPMELESTTF